MGDSIFLGQIIQFSGNYEMEGFTFCDGRSLSIIGNNALFSIIGNRFGGDGIKTFNLPKIESVNGITYLISTSDAIYPVKKSY